MGIKINDLTPRNQYSATGGQTVFIYSFPIRKESDLLVYKRLPTAAPNDTTDKLTLTVDYTVTGVGNETGGTIVLTAGATLNDVVTIERDIPKARTSVYSSNQPIKGDDLEKDFDNDIMMLQDNEMTNDVRNLAYPRSAVIGNKDRVLPMLNKQEIWRMNEAENSLENVTLPDCDRAAPSDLKYIIQQPYTPALPNAQALSDLNTGIMKSTTSSGVVSILNGSSSITTISNDLDLGPGSGSPDYIPTQFAVRYYVNNNTFWYRNLSAYNYLIPKHPNDNIGSNGIRIAKGWFDEIDITTPLQQASGGTGLDTSGVTDGQLLIGGTSGHTFGLSTIDAGHAIAITNSSHSILIEADVNDNFRHRNVIIGGDLTKNPWQRGTSFTNPVHNEYTADCFSNYVAGTGWGLTVTNDNDSPDFEHCNIISTSSIKYTVNTAKTPGTSDYYGMLYNIEGYNCSDLYYKINTLGFWVKSNIKGVFSITMTDDAYTAYYIVYYEITHPDEWEFHYLNFREMRTGIGTWNVDNRTGIRLLFCLSSGTDFMSGNTDKWFSGHQFAFDKQENLFNTVGNYIKFNLVQLETGDKASLFEDRSIQHELLLCQRYYEKSFEIGVAPAQNTHTRNGELSYRVANAAGAAQSVVRSFAVQKRDNPTVVFYNPYNTNANWHNYTTANDSGNASIVDFSEKQLVVLNPQVGADGVANQISVHWSADASL